MSTLGSAVIFTEKQYEKRVCQKVQVYIFHHPSQRLIEECEVQERIQQGAQGAAVGLPLSQLCTRAIASTVGAHSFVREKIIYKTWTGDLKVLVWPETVIARVLTLRGPDQYVTEQGTLLPLSRTRTARTLLVEIDAALGEEKIFFQGDCGRSLCVLLCNLYHNSLWRAQVSHLRLDKDGKVVLHTQIGAQRIEFGSLKSMSEKLSKLKLYYEKVIPRKGWSAHKRINLEFDNQIVCA